MRSVSLLLLGLFVIAPRFFFVLWRVRIDSPGGPAHSATSGPSGQEEKQRLTEFPAGFTAPRRKEKTVHSARSWLSLASTRGFLMNL